MKKAFTLLEVVLALSIFMILVVFLYKTLDQTKFSNKLFTNKVQKAKKLNYVYDLILKDIALSKSINNSTFDRDKNSRVVLSSTNTYHNPYYTNIAYMINSQNELVRVESKNPMSVKDETPPSFEFYESAYIDVLMVDIEYFEVQKSLQDTKNYIFVIKQKDKEQLVFNTYKLNNIQTPTSSSGGGNNADDNEKK